MKTKKQHSTHAHLTVKSLFKPRKRRLPLSITLTILALVTATYFYTSQPPTVQAVSTTILISEVEYDPPLTGTDTSDEWFELVNISSTPQTLTGWTISDDGGTDTIPIVTLTPGERVVVAATTNFTTNHPTYTGQLVVIADGSIGNGLANGGDVLTLRDNTTAPIDCVSWGSNTSCFSPSVGTTVANTTQTTQRISNIDHDTREDWTNAAETPGAPSGFTGIVFDQSGRGCSFFDLLTPPLLTWTQSISSGTNRILMVGVSTYTVTAAPATRVLTVTYGGQLMTRIDDTLARSTTNQSQVEMFYLLEPGIAAATSTTVQVTFNPVLTSTTAYAVGGSSSFLFVNQSTPFNTNQATGSSTSQGVSPTFARRAGTTAAPTLTAASNPGEMVFDTVASVWTGIGSAVLTVNSTQIERWNGKDGPCFVGGDSVGAGSTEVATGTSTIMSWSLNASNPWVSGAVSLVPQAVTAVKLSSVTATESNGSVALRWQTGFEVDNLGFNVYREVRGKRTRINPSIIAGSALLARQGTSLTAGQSYAWRDRTNQGKETVQYWLEDIDLDGTRTLHGPIVPSVASAASSASFEQSIQLSQLNQEQAGAHVSIKGYPVAESLRADALVPSDAEPQGRAPEAPQRQSRLAAKLLLLNEEVWESVIKGTSTEPNARTSNAQANLANGHNAQATGAALKIAIRQAGWYRITQPELVAAGLSPNVDPRNLQLYADGIEQPIQQTGANLFDTSGSIEFYATGMDTASSDRRIYWLVAGAQPGRRIEDEIGLGRNLPVETTPLGPIVITIPETPTVTHPPIIAPGASQRPSASTPTLSGPPVMGRELPLIPLIQPRLILNEAQPAIAVEPAPKAKASKKKKQLRRKARQQLSHAQGRRAAQDFSASQSFAYVIERKERINYFSGLLNGDAENFFGPLVLSGAETRQDLSVNHLDSTATTQATLEIALQGLTAQAHEVRVLLNGAEVGTVSFTDLEHPVARFNLPHTSLIAGNNALALRSQSGEADISLVDYVRLTYRHTYRAENDALTFTSLHTTPLTVTDFTSPGIRVFDISDPDAVAQVNAKASKTDSGYAVKIPAGRGALRTLLAITESQVLHPAEITLNEPSNLAGTDNRADFVILTPRSFRDAVKPLADLRRSQGMEVAVVDVEDVYDEFSYGAHSSQAIKDFLSWAKQSWTLAPRYALLFGDASLDPRNYLGFGQGDFVPTRLIDATLLETSSDDALADFNNDGLADIAVGRLPVKTPAEAQKVISKIVSYAPGQPAYNALLVSDRKEGYDFEAANNQVKNLLPQDLGVTFVNRRDNSIEQVRSELLGGINAGPLLVNYAGHGSSDVWTGAGILSATDAAALTNGNRLPFFVIMTCLNGRFQDPFRETLSEALMRADKGGAIATWSSSGLTEPDAQSAIDQQLMRLLFAEGQSPLLGDAVRGAKAATTNYDVRRTWILFGDPTMRIR